MKNRHREVEVEPLTQRRRDRAFVDAGDRRHGSASGSSSSQHRRPVGLTKTTLRSVAPHVPAAVMHEPMMKSAQERAVAGVRRAAEYVVREDLHERTPRASGEATSAVRVRAYLRTECSSCDAVAAREVDQVGLAGRGGDSPQRSYLGVAEPAGGDQRQLFQCVFQCAPDPNVLARRDVARRAAPDSRCAIDRQPHDVAALCPASVQTWASSCSVGATRSARTPVMKPSLHVHEPTFGTAV